MILDQHSAFVDEWSRVHRQCLLDEAEAHRRLQECLAHKRGPGAWICTRLGALLVASGVWLLNRYGQAEYRAPSAVARSEAGRC
jgi:hypothetical protein